MAGRCHIGSVWLQLGHRTNRAKKDGVVDPTQEVRGKAIEARSQFYDDADRTEPCSQEIVQYQRGEPPEPLLH